MKGNSMEMHELDGRFGMVMLTKKQAYQTDVKEITDYINANMHVHEKVVDAKGVILIGHSPLFEVMTTKNVGLNRYAVAEELDFVNTKGKRYVFKKVS